MVETDAGTTVGEHLELNDADEGPDDDSPRRAPDVFISYRLDPDQATAIALKKLIAGSLDPAPAVFVSGAGGLVPSSIGLRPQLQKAVASAKAFVAIITPQSKDREFVIFEAGAAWGRGQLYSPVLIETEPHELGTTIADFVATRAETRDQMENLVRELAKTLGATMKTHFGTRFSAFERHLEQRKGLEKKSASSDRVAGSMRAFSLWQQGKREEALQAFSEAEAEAKTEEERADAKIGRLSVEHEGERFREALDALDEGLRATASWNLWKGAAAGSPHYAIAHYDKVISTDTALPQDRTFAFKGRIENLFALGKQADGKRSSMEAIENGPPKGRWTIAGVLWSEATDLSSEAKLLLAARSLSNADGDLFRRLSDLAIDEGWLGLGIFAARNYRRKDEGSSSLNMLGRAYHGAALMSLAHDAYREAIAAGASVARVNLALCLRTSPNNGAALALLREHKGDFDSLDVAFPHQIRADAERAIAEEKKTADAMSKRGYATLAMLAELIDDPKSRLAVDLRDRNVDGTGSKPLFSILRAVAPFAGVFVGRGDGTLIGFFVPAADSSSFRGVTFDLSGETEPAWTTVKVQ